MKYNYKAPQSEILATRLSSCILENSLVDTYEGEGTTLVDGQW